MARPRKPPSSAPTMPKLNYTTLGHSRVQSLVGAADIAGLTAHHVGPYLLLDAHADDCDRAVPLGTDADVLASRITVADGEVFRLTVEHELNGAASLLGEECSNDGVLPGNLLATKTTTHVMLDDADGVFGQVERFGNFLTDFEYGLRGIPQRQAVAIPGDGAAVGL